MPKNGVRIGRCDQPLTGTEGGQPRRRQCSIFVHEDVSSPRRWSSSWLSPWPPSTQCHSQAPITLEFMSGSSHEPWLFQLHGWNNQSWNYWGLCWEIDVGPPLLTLLQPEMPTDDAGSGKCDQPFVCIIAKRPSTLETKLLSQNWRSCLQTESPSPRENPPTSFKVHKQQWTGRTDELKQLKFKTLGNQWSGRTGS